TYSARFPVISPNGDIRGKGDCLADRVVDGGYFENYGATTALEIAEALRRRGADPFVLMITNDPEPPQGADDTLRQTVSERELVRIRGGLPTAIAPTVGGENAARWDSWSPDSLEEWNQGPGAPEKKYSRCPITRPCYDRNGPPHPRNLTEPPQLALIAPVMTLFATRTARGTYSGRELSEKLNDGRNLCGFRRIGVFDDCKSRRQPDCPDLSMSWWLSYPVQEFLDTQMRESSPHGNNQAALSEIDCILSKKPAAECYAEPATLSNRP
ncbi:MAG: hypothetical protein HKN60_01335, partial [Rhizobiales bacterium]|nr:hypothetical protein [Hyphomicrobiales bacterium]